LTNPQFNKKSHLLLIIFSNTAKISEMTPAHPAVAHHFPPEEP